MSTPLASTPAAVDSTAEVDAMSSEGPRSPYVNLRKQIKYVVIGASGVWYWQVRLHLSDALRGGWTSWCVVVGQGKGLGSGGGVNCHS